MGAKELHKFKVAGLVVTRIYKENWLAKALRPSGTVIDSSARDSREKAVADLCRFISRKPSEFIEHEVSPNEYHYVPRDE